MWCILITSAGWITYFLVGRAYFILSSLRKCKKLKLVLNNVVFTLCIRDATEFRTSEIRCNDTRRVPGWRQVRSQCFAFLAHLSRRLTRWANSIPMVRRPSVVVRRRPSSSSTLSNLNISEAIWPILIRYSSLGWGKGCIRFWGRLDQNSGFHSNRKLPLAYNGENDVSTFSRLFLIRSFLYMYLQVMRTCIKSRTSSNFGQIGPLTTKLAALERLKKFP